jgi:hypothetical protein
MEMLLKIYLRQKILPIAAISGRETKLLLNIGRKYWQKFLEIPRNDGGIKKWNRISHLAQSFI